VSQHHEERGRALTENSNRLASLWEEEKKQDGKTVKKDMTLRRLKEDVQNQNNSTVRDNDNRRRCSVK